MEREENIKPFPSLLTILENRKCSDFTHPHRTDYDEFLEGHTLTFLRCPQRHSYRAPEKCHGPAACIPDRERWR